MLRQGTLSLFYVPPDLEPGEAAQAVALQLPEEFEWTRSEFRAVAMEALRTAAFDAVSKLKRVRRFWLALERAAKAGCPMKVGSDLVGREALSVTFFPEAVDMTDEVDREVIAGREAAAEVYRQQLDAQRVKAHEDYREEQRARPDYFMLKDRYRR